MDAGQHDEGLARGDAARRAADSFLREVFAYAPLGISVTETETRRIVAANPRFGEIAGRTVDQVVGMDWVDLNHPEDAAADLMLEGALDAASYRMPKRYLRPDGTMVWVEMSRAMPENHRG